MSFLAVHLWLIRDHNSNIREIHLEVVVALWQSVFSLHLSTCRTFLTNNGFQPSQSMTQPVF